MKVLKEWFVKVPWGKVALMSWGNPSGFPVLLVHGRQDSLATFTPLLELLPESYHYVGMELPGHGLSDPFPTGVMLMRFQNVVVVDMVLKHLGWNEFYYLAHSLGTEQGLFYNAIYPNRIKKLILLDPGPALGKIQIKRFSDYFPYFHGDYYGNYEKYNRDMRVFSKRGAVQAVMKARGLTQAQAELILSRNLKKVGEDQYQLSWDHRLKNPAALNLPDDYYCQLFSTNCPPTLIVSANGPRTPTSLHIQAVDRLLKRIQERVPNFFILYVEGGHDVHLTNPERFVKELCEFLTRDFEKVDSKL